MGSLNFIDRLNEFNRLSRLAISETGGLAVLWGRRRVGKTRLLTEWTRRFDGCYLVADESAATIQRSYLAQALEARFAGFSDVQYPDWQSFFRRISSECRNSSWRGPLVIDELPYLVKKAAELPSVLQHWLDHDAKQLGLVVALSGSTQQMMQGMVLDSSSPLYGRARELMQLGPLAPRWLKEIFPTLRPVELIKYYSVWGGTPLYWELLAGLAHHSFGQQIDSLVLDPLGPLHREPDRLLMEEDPPAINLRAILDTIGNGAHRLSEIGGRLQSAATGLSRPLNRLIDLGLIYKEYSFGESEKSSKRTLYKIADPFWRFWFRIVAPNRTILAQAPEATRLALWQREAEPLFVDCWEELCRRAVVGFAEDTLLGQLGPWKPARRFWFGAGPEFDVVAESLDGQRLLLGEVKWSEKRPSQQFLERTSQDLFQKGLPAKLGGKYRQIVYAVFIPQTPQTPTSSPNSILISADEVLEALA